MASAFWYNKLVLRFNPLISSFILTWLLLLGQKSNAQNPVWADSCISSSFVGLLKQTGLGFSQFNNVHECSNRDLVVTGYIKPDITTTPVYKMYAIVMRVFPTGEASWIRYFGYDDLNFSSTTRVATSTLTQNGDIVIITYSDMSSPQRGNALIRLSPSGNLIWKKRLDDDNPSIVYEQIIETSDGGFLVGGINSRMTRVAKLNGTGDLLWRRDYGGPEFYINCRTITETPSAYYISGRYSINQIGISQNHLIRLNKLTGDTVWIRSFGSPGDVAEFGYDYMQFHNNRLLLHGSSYIGLGFPAVKSAQSQVSFNELGELTESRIMENTTIEMQRTGIFRKRTFDPVTRSGVQYIMSDTSDFYVYRLNEANQPSWSWRFPIPGNEVAMDMQVTQDSSIVIAGNSILNVANDNDRAILIKTAPQGTLDNCTYTPSAMQITNRPVIVKNGLGISYTSANSDPLAISTLPLFNGLDHNWWLSCKTQSNCYMSEIEGPDTVCVGVPAIYKVTRKGFCNPLVGFDMIYINSQTQRLSDTSVSIQFNSSGITTLYAGFDVSCGRLRDSLHITVLPPASSVMLGPDAYLCQPTLTIKAGRLYKTYEWSDGSSDSVLTITAPGKYYVTVMDYCGNLSADTMEVFPSPVIDYQVMNDTAICPKDTIQLVAPPGFYNYQWGPASDLTMIDSNIVKVYPGADRIYISSAEKFNGCMVTDTIRVRVFVTDLVSAGMDTFFCRSDSTAVSATSGFLSYLWNTGATSASIQVKQEGLYSVKAIDANGCPSKDTINVTVKENPVPVITPYSSICTNEPRLLSVSPSFSNYLWHDNSVGPELSARDTGWYSVRVSDINGCNGTDSVHITKYVLPPTGFLGKDSSVCKYSPIILHPIGEFKEYNWSSGAATSSITTNQPGMYWLQVKDMNDCSNRDSINLKEITCSQLLTFPNAFTPNRNGKNDSFKPLVRGVPGFYQLTIFNRWGQKVFETNDYLKGWDGTINSQSQATGAYTFISNYSFPGEAKKQIKGSFILIR